MARRLRAMHYAISDFPFRLIGVVVRDKMDKTRRVDVSSFQMHPLYKKRLRRTTSCYVHDELNCTKNGDVVEIEATRPLSRLKRWRLLRVVRRGAESVQPASDATQSFGELATRLITAVAAFYEVTPTEKSNPPRLWSPGIRSRILHDPGASNALQLYAAHRTTDLKAALHRRIVPLLACAVTGAEMSAYGLEARPESSRRRYRQSTPVACPPYLHVLLDLTFQASFIGTERHVLLHSARALTRSTPGAPLVAPVGREFSCGVYVSLPHEVTQVEHAGRLLDVQILCGDAKTFPSRLLLNPASDLDCFRDFIFVPVVVGQYRFRVIVRLGDRIIGDMRFDVSTTGAPPC